jgi:hypothetical protein
MITQIKWILACFLSMVLHTVCASTSIKIEALVHDPSGVSIPGAEVTGYFMFYSGIVDSTRLNKALTDKYGVAYIEGEAQFNYGLSAQRTGYYITRLPERSIDSAENIKKYGLGLQKVAIELRPIKNPVESICFGVSDFAFPVYGKAIGFDLVQGDWLPPYGKGIVADFNWTLDYDFSAKKQFKLRLTLSFKKQGDGIQYYKINALSGSDFKYPYEAPDYGYLTNLSFDQSAAKEGFTNTFTESTSDQYIFRVRSEVNDRGEVIRALYGIIDMSPVIRGAGLNAPRFSYSYFLNPNWTKNLEFDAKKIKNPVK